MSAEPKLAQIAGALGEAHRLGLLHRDVKPANIPLLQAARAEIELHGFEAVSFSALAKALGVSQPAPYRHFADRDALLAAVAAEGFRELRAALRESVKTASRTSKALRMARAYLAFGLRFGGIYRLMFASRLTPAAAAGSELQMAARETFDLFLEVLGPSTSSPTRERHALKIWAALHGVITLSEHLLTGTLAHVSLEELVDDIVE